MILELEDVIKIIDEEVEFAKKVNSQMALGMLQVKDLIIKEEKKKIDFMQSLTSAPLKFQGIKSIQQQMEEWENDPD